MAKKENEEPTASSTDMAEDSPLPEYQKLLGSRNLRRSSVGQSLALLRMPQFALTSALEKVFGLSKTPDKSERHVDVVLGPLTFDKIKSLLEEGCVRSSDVMLKGFDRWKSCKTYFPDITGGDFDSQEETHTPTDTGTAGDGLFEETPVEHMISREPSTGASAPLDEELAQRIGEIKDEVVEVETLPDDKLRGISKDRGELQGRSLNEPLHRKDIFGGTHKASSGRVPLGSGASRTEDLSRGQSIEVQSKLSNRLSFQSLFRFVFLLLAAGVSFWLFNRSPYRLKSGRPLDEHTTSHTEGNGKVSEISSQSKITVDSGAWPSDLRPITLEQLYERGDESDRIVKNIRRILNDYRKNGARIFSRADEEYLLRQSQPGAASADGQVLALNSLAVHYLNQRNPSAAFQKLKQFIDEENILDLASLVNLGVSMFEAGVPYESAKPYLASAIRKAGEYPSSIFFPTTLNVVYATKAMLDPKQSEIDSEFSSIEQKYGSHPIFYGLWIRNLQRLKTPPKDRIQQLLEKALWGDPDRIFDSGFESIPLARQWFISQAFDGLRAAAQAPDCKLTRGQRDFLDLMMSTKGSTYEFRRMRSSDLRDVLDRERINHSLSGLLFAFLLKDEGRFSEAAEALSLLFQDPVKNEMLSETSYAYALAGELAMYLGKTNDAKIYFSNALNSPFEVLALWGMALLSRENVSVVGNRAVIEAGGKLAETQSADRNFIPVLLRRERLTWHQSVAIP